MECIRVVDDVNISVSHVDRIPWIGKDQDGKSIKVNSSRVKVFFMEGYLPKKVSIWFTQRNVSAYIPGIRTCHKCLRYGHIKAQSRAKNARCSRCAAADHSEDACPRPDIPDSYECWHCSEAHSALSRKCPIYIHSKRVLAEKIERENQREYMEQAHGDTFQAWNYEQEFPQMRQITKSTKVTRSLPDRAPANRVVTAGEGRQQFSQQRRGVRQFQ